MKDTYRFTRLVMRQLRKKEIKKMFKEFKREQEIYLILENIQYARNVASIFRTADAAGVRRMYLTGISKTPPFGKELMQTSRFKEKSVEWMYQENTASLIQSLKKKEFYVVAVELTDSAISMYELTDKIHDHDKVAFVFGSEVFGVKKETLAACHEAMFIPMYGRGASLNVGASVAIALYSI